MPLGTPADNLGNLHRTAAHTDPEHFAVMAGKGEFLLHGLIGGASGAIAALVNMYVQSPRLPPLLREELRYETRIKRKG